jgi:hypothetical protein
VILPILPAAVVAASAPDYRDDAAWLCRPGRIDACTPDPVRTVVAADGSMRRESMKPSPPPAADCFYVYPTASLDPGPNSDMTPGIEEAGQATSQAAAFASVCHVFAPVYRQVTLTALRAGNVATADWAMAYGDVRAAFADYLARDNRGRPFVLIGHSQGAALLKRLAVETIDGAPLSGQLLSAILPGTTVLVPRGQRVGGDFKALPLCTALAQTGCVVTWASYRDEPGPPPNGLFGATSDAAMEAGCTAPTRNGSALDAVFGFPWWERGYVQYRAPAAWIAPTRFARIPRLVSGECVTRGRFHYLAIHVDPAVGGALGRAAMDPAIVGDAAFPEWGLHVLDVHLVQGDLVRRVAAQTHAWTAARR